MNYVRSFDKIRVGDNASFTKTITETDVVLFAGITGDLNPLHIDKEYAKNATFEGRVVHGLLTAGLISAVIGTKLPGPGTVYLRQTLKFTAPVRIGETVTAQVEVLEKDEKHNFLTLKTVCKDGNNKVVLEGEALVMLPKKSAHDLESLRV